MNTIEEIKCELAHLVDDGKIVLDLIESKSPTIEFIDAYQNWYTRAAKVVAISGADRLEDFHSYYLPNPNRTRLVPVTYVIRDYISCTSLSWGVEVTKSKFAAQLGILKSLSTRIDSAQSLDDLGLYSRQPSSKLSNTKDRTEANKHLDRVFVVHGQDEEMKQAVARVLQSMNLEPIILHEQPDGNKTIIEKFEKYSDVDFAMILLSPDDFAYMKGGSPSEGKFRARQNVILELGYFLAKLNREGVFILYRQNDNFEFPSDYSGVLYTLYDKSGAWKYKLAEEMAAFRSSN